MSGDDLLDSSYYRPLFTLLAEMDHAIAAVYAGRGEERVATRFVGPVITLSRRGPLSVKQLAAEREVTHSAMSQTVAAMVRAGFVSLSPGADARTRIVALTEAGRDLVPLAQAEWRATEATVRELDEEIPYPLLRAVADVRAALETRSFTARLEAQLNRSLRDPR